MNFVTQQWYQVMSNYIIKTQTTISSRFPSKLKFLTESIWTSFLWAVTHTVSRWCSMSSWKFLCHFHEYHKKLKWQIEVYPKDTERKKKNCTFSYANDDHDLIEMIFFAFFSILLPSDCITPSKKFLCELIAKLF